MPLPLPLGACARLLQRWLGGSHPAQPPRPADVTQGKRELTADRLRRRQAAILRVLDYREETLRQAAASAGGGAGSGGSATATDADADDADDADDAGADDD